MSLLERDWKECDPTTITGWEALAWWYDHVHGDETARQVSDAWARRVRNTAYLWILGVARRCLPAGAGGDAAESREDRARFLAGVFTEEIMTQKFRLEYVNDERSLRRFVARRIGWRNGDTFRRSQSKPASRKKEDESAPSVQEPLGSAPNPTTKTSNEEPVSDLAVLTQARMQAMGKDQLADLLRVHLIEPCAAAQKQQRTREGVERGLNELLDLRHGRVTAEELVLAEMRECGDDIESPHARRAAHERVGKRRRRSRLALDRWLPSWIAEVTDEGDWRGRADLAAAAEDCFRLRARSESASVGDEHEEEP